MTNAAFSWYGTVLILPTVVESFAGISYGVSYILSFPNHDDFMESCIEPMQLVDPRGLVIDIHYETQILIFHIFDHNHHSMCALFSKIRLDIWSVQIVNDNSVDYQMEERSYISNCNRS